MVQVVQGAFDLLGRHAHELGGGGPGPHWDHGPRAVVLEGRSKQDLGVAAGGAGVDDTIRLTGVGPGAAVGHRHADGLRIQSHIQASFFILWGLRAA